MHSNPNSSRTNQKQLQLHHESLCHRAIPELPLKPTLKRKAVVTTRLHYNSLPHSNKSIKNSGAVDRSARKLEFPPGSSQRIHVHWCNEAHGSTIFNRSVVSSPFPPPVLDAQINEFFGGKYLLSAMRTEQRNWMPFYRQFKVRWTARRR